MNASLLRGDPRRISCCLLSLLLAGGDAWAQVPTGGVVAHGEATINQAGNTMTVTQASRHAIMNWQSFSLGADASFRLQQPAAEAAMLARVVGGEASQLLGALEADGKLFLINPRGIVVGRGAVIDTAAFVASTLDVTDDAFLRGGALTFRGESTAGVVNLGRITAREGNVLLFAHTVTNAGQLEAPQGTVGLGAGTEVYLAAPDAGNFVIRANLPGAARSTGVENSGTIAAAQAQLEAAGGSVYELAVNQSGVVRATGVDTRNGRVLLTAAGGTVGVSGEISARNADGSGGEILVGGDYRGDNSAVANATRAVVTSTAKLDASASSGAAAAGRVIVWADDATRFLGRIDARGQGGGFAEVSGKRWLDFNPSAPVALGAGGTLLLDPEALIISADADSGTATSGSNPFVFGATSEPATLNVGTLQDQLALTNVLLDTSTSGGDVTFNAPVAWASDHELRVQAGGSIFIEADISGGAGSTLALYPGRATLSDIPGELGGHDLNPGARLDAGATITVGTLVYGANGASNVADQTVVTPAYTGTGLFYGNLRVGTLEVDLAGGSAGVATEGSDNAISTFHASGPGGLDFTFVADHHGGLDVQIVSEASPAPVLVFETPGTLTLLDGTTLNFERERDIILASTGGAFVNRAGASAFGANVRHLIYSSRPGANTKGGLAGTDVFNHVYDRNDDFSGDRIARFFFTVDSALPTLLYTADSFTRRYGAANPAFAYTITGWQDGVANDVTGQPQLSTTATQRSGVGGYTIEISQGSLASANYDFGFVDGTLTIERAPLTVTANDKTRRVGLDNPAFDASFAGLVLDEDASALGGTLGFSTSATRASAAGDYAITPSGLTSANYDITFRPGTLTLTETAALLISADDVARTYGAANPAFTASFSGFVGGDTEDLVTGLQFSTTATQSSGVGEYTITPFGAVAPGYDISYETGRLTIERAPLTVSVPSQARFYGDANDLTFSFNGLVNGDSSSVVTGLVVAAAATPVSNVGTYAITASGAVADNYRITYSVGSLSVLPAPLTVNITPATRVYGDADPAFTYTVSGLKNDDSAANSVRFDGLASLAPAEAGIGDYGIVGFPSPLSPNYTVAPQASGTLTITPRPLTIRAHDQSRTYGDANPEFTATFEGLAAFDTPALFGDLGLRTPATPSSGVGEWGITFATVSHPNYTITPRFGTLTITPAPLTLQPLVELSRVYGRANPAMPLPEVGGLKLADTAASLGLAFETPALTADVGSYTYRLTTTNPNYSLAAATGEFRINPAPLTVAIAPTSRVYGDANPASYEIVANGLAFDDTATDVVGVFNPTDTFTGVGTYAVEPRLLSANYVVQSFTGGGFTIAPRPLIFTAADRTRVYGDINPFFFGSITGFVNGDGEFNVVSNHGFVTTADRSSPVGTYGIRPWAQVTANYVPVFQEGRLTVTPATATVVIGDAARAYGRVNPVFEIEQVEGLKNDDTVLSLALNVTADAGVASDVGTYPITGVSRTPNYIVTFVPGTLTIERASASIAGGTASRPFGDVITSLPAITFAGFLEADEMQARRNWQVLFTDAPTLAPGAHATDFTQAHPEVGAALAKNYDITFTPGTVNVTPRRFVITAPDYASALGAAFTSPFALPPPALLPGAALFTVIARSDAPGTRIGEFRIVPEIVPGAGVSREELDRYYDFDLQPGVHSVTRPQDVIDLTQTLDPGRLTTLNNGSNTIHVEVRTTNETVEVETEETLTIAANPYVDFSTAPLSRSDYGGYFASFAEEMDAVKAALAGSYRSFVAGAGQKDSAYESMSAGARALLAGWMKGSITLEALREGIATGDAAATEAFGFILPTLIERTRDKDLAEMTSLDRRILGRLADLTEKRRADTVRIARQKYDEMIAAQAARAENASAATVLFYGPGDFQNIVDRATEEAVGAYVGGVIAGASVAALTPVLFVKAVSYAVFPHSAVGGAAAGGPAVVAALAVALAVRSVQISESIQNEEAYHALMSSYQLGEEVTSIADLQSAAMDKDMKLSTLMLATELLKSE